MMGFVLVSAQAGLKHDRRSSSAAERAGPAGVEALGDVVSVQRVRDIVVSLRPPPKPSDVIIVSLDDYAVEVLGSREVIPRDYLAHGEMATSALGIRAAQEVLAR
jgi:hypothetical protein